MGTENRSAGPKLKVEDIRIRRDCLRWIVAAASVVMFGFLAGCADLGVQPGLPDYDVAAGHARVSFADSLLSSFNQGLAAGGADGLKDSPYFVADDSNSATIGVAGGRLTLKFEGKEIVFVVSAGALSSPVEISIHGYKFRMEDGSEVYLYECGPGGTAFAIPMIVDHPVNSGEGTSTGLFFDDDEGTIWQIEQISPVVDGVARFHIHHFSKYAIT